MTGDKAGEAKRRKEFKIPMHNAPNEMINMYGNIRRFKKTASANCLGSEIKPYPIILIINGEKIMPSTDTKVRIMERIVNAL